MKRGSFHGSSGNVYGSSGDVYGGSRNFISMEAVKAPMEVLAGIRGNSNKATLDSFWQLLGIPRKPTRNRQAKQSARNRGNRPDSS